MSDDGSEPFIAFELIAKGGNEKLRPLWIETFRLGQDES